MQLLESRSRPGGPIPALSAEAAQLLLTYPWPGNVRELDNLLQRALILLNGPVIGPEHIQFEPAPAVAAGAPAAAAACVPEPVLAPVAMEVVPVREAASEASGSLADSLGQVERCWRPCAMAPARAARSPNASASHPGPCVTSLPACVRPALMFLPFETEHP